VSGSPVESLVIQTSFLGDTVLTTPLIAELAMRGPVDVLVTSASAPLLANDPSIRTLFIYDKRGPEGGLGGLWRAVCQIRRQQEIGRPNVRRVAYLAQGSVRSATLAVLAGFRERVGFSAAAGRALYTRRVRRRDDRHHAERLWRLAFPEQPSIEPPEGALRPRLYPGEQEVAAVDALLGPRQSALPFVALAPGSVWATKRWPYYPDLARRIVPRHRLVIVGSAADAEAARDILAAVGRHRAVDATGKLSLLASAELIGRAAALVTNDSSPQHLASAMGTPTITAFGPTVPDFGFGPLAPRSITVGHEALACRPCHHHGPPRCPLGHWRCMREVGVERVEEAVKAILER
jgi:heptosyltransferase II